MAISLARIVSYRDMEIGSIWIVRRDVNRTGSSLPKHNFQGHTARLIAGFSSCASAHSIPPFRRSYSSRGAARPKLRHGRPLLAPFGRLLIGMRRAEYRRLLEWFADKLDRHRQPAYAESTTNRERWLPCDVEWNGKAWLLQYRPLRHRVDSRRLGRLRRRQQYVYLLHRRRCRRAKLAPPPNRLHVVDAANQSAERHAIAQQLAVFLEAGLQPTLVQREGFRHQDKEAARRIIRQRRQCHLAHLGAEAAQHVHRPIDSLLRALAHLVVGLVKMPHDADAHPLHAASERGRVIWRAAAGTRGIGRVGTGHRLQQYRAILDRPGQRPGVIQAEGQRQYSRPAAQTVGRLDTGDTAQRRRPANRTAGVRPGTAEDQARRDRRARAGRRSAGEMIGVPRITRGRPWQVEGRTSEGELVRREFAQHHRAGFRELAHGARGAVDVLVPDRDAVELAACTACHYARLCGTRI